MKRISLILLALIFSSACYRVPPTSPEEAALQDAQMRQVLSNSSPRDLNEHPKVDNELLITTPGL